MNIFTDYIFKQILQECGINELIDVFAYVELFFFILICFFGYKLLKIIITINGAIIGGIIGAIGGVVDSLSYSSEPAMILVFILFGMVLFGFLAFKLYRLGIFLHYFLCGTIFSATFLYICGISRQEYQMPTVIVISVGIGILTGVLALIFSKIYIIVSSAIMGGFGAASSISVIVAGLNAASSGEMSMKGVYAAQYYGSKVVTTSSNMEISPGLEFLIGLFLAIFGAVVQFMMENKKNMAINSNIGYKCYGNNMLQNDNLQINKLSDEQVYFCPKCGTKIFYRGIRFCPLCGIDLSDIMKMFSGLPSTEQVIGHENTESNNIDAPESDAKNTESKNEQNTEQLKIKYCASCGTKLDTDAGFCLKCGLKQVM